MKIYFNWCIRMTVKYCGLKTDIFSFRKSSSWQPVRSYSFILFFYFWIFQHALYVISMYSFPVDTTHQCFFFLMLLYFFLWCFIYILYIHMHYIIIIIIIPIVTQIFPASQLCTQNWGPKKCNFFYGRKENDKYKLRLHLLLFQYISRTLYIVLKNVKIPATHLMVNLRQLLGTLSCYRAFKCKGGMLMIFFFFFAVLSTMALAHGLSESCIDV